MFCAFHPKRLSERQCDRCHTGVCPQCQIIVKGQVLCPTCAPVVAPQSKVYPPRRPLLAALFSFFWPGLGQVYNGQVLKGVVIFATSWLVLPWLYGIVDAMVTADKINRRGMHTTPSLIYFSLCLMVFSIILIGEYRTITAKVNEFHYKRSPTHILSTLSKSLEEYQRQYHRYPQTTSEVFFSDDLLAEEFYCGGEIAGYRYTCDFASDGYRVSAMPSGKESASAGNYTLETGGPVVFSEPEKEK